MRRPVLLVGGFGVLLAAVVSFQNCGVRRLAVTSTGQDGLANNLLATGAANTTTGTGNTAAGTGTSTGTGTGTSTGTTTGTSGSTSSASTAPASGAGSASGTSSNTSSGSNAGSGGSCTAGPVSPSSTPYVLSAAISSQDATISRYNMSALKKTDVMIMATNNCVTPNHTCAASTSQNTQCKSQKSSTLVISFRCSNDPNATSCDLITPGTVIDLAGTASDASTKYLSITLQDTTDICDTTKMKTFMTLDLKKTFKNIGGKVTFTKVPNLAAGNRFEVQLDNVELHTQDGASVAKMSGTYFSDVSCVQAYNQ